MNPWLIFALAMAFAVVGGLALAAWLTAPFREGKR